MPIIDLMQTNLRDLLDDELGDSFAPLNTNRVLGIEVDCADLELATVMSIDEAWRVCHRQALTKREAASWLHEACIAIRNGDGEASAHKTALERLQDHIFGGTQIETSITLIGVAWQFHFFVKALYRQDDMVFAHLLRLLSSSLNSSISLKSR